MSDLKQTQLFVATTNEGKITEIHHALDDLPIEITTLKDATGTEICPEDKPTVLENAIFKAMHYSRFSDAMTLADDTGLEVDALGGSPGVHSARYAGPSATYAENNQKLLKELAAVPEGKRAARFVCVMAIAYRGRLLKSFQGVCEGRVLTCLRGSGGFGYDPLFFIPALNKTFAELSTEEKNKISHRGKALLRVYDYFQYQIESSQG
jgi:XTP/dITP diphosphohydrolase